MNGLFYLGSVLMLPLFIGLMSGTSLDGVDGVLADLSSDQHSHVLANTYLPFDDELRQTFLALQSSGEDELAREAKAANQLADLYARCVHRLLEQSGLQARAVCAIGAHGQTLRHRPECGYTWQSLNPARLVEKTSIDVVADFRRRDIAAGGQGAPLVPAFHAAMFQAPQWLRVIVNIGGIANITVLPPPGIGHVQGWDTGPGNVLLDAWMHHHHPTQRFDAQGQWASQGRILPDLLQMMWAEPYFTSSPPKSTGRDLFHMAWLTHCLAESAPQAVAVDVQATLCELTAQSIGYEITQVRQALLLDAPALANCKLGVYVCGGGAYNTYLINRLATYLPVDTTLATTEVLGVAPSHVEALAFAWLAKRCVQRAPGNLTAVTGAVADRILGAIYPA